MTQNWQRLMEEISRYRDTKGFHMADWDTAGSRFACIAAEIWEVEEALQEEDLEHAGNELAGVITYVIGLQSDLGLELGTQRTRLQRRVTRFSSAAEITAVLREYWRLAFEAWRRSDKKNTAIALELLVCAVLHIRNNVLRLPGELVEDCLKSLENGANRPWRHGGKHPLT